MSNWTKPKNNNGVVSDFEMTADNWILQNSVGERVAVTYKGVVVGYIAAAEDDEGNLLLAGNLSGEKTTFGFINEEDWKK